MEYKLKEILQEKGYIRGPFGSSLKRRELKHSGIPVYEQQHAIYSNREFRYYIDTEKYNEMKRFSVRANDLIISCSGTIGKVDLISESDEIGIISQALLILRANTDIILPKYLYYFFKSNYGYNSITSRSMGSVQINIAKREVIENIKINVPDIENQKKTVKILSDIDKKIELNNQINDNLHEIILNIYNEKIKNNSKDKFKIKTLDEICNVFTGKKNANASEEDGKYKFFTCAPEPLNINTFIYDGPAIIVAGNGAYTGRTTFYNGKFDLYQRTYAITEKNLKDYIYLLYAMVKADLQENIMGGTHGSAIPYIVMDDIAKFKVKYNEKIFDDLSQKVKSMLTKIKENEKENQILSQLRDTLLPQLMNGEIDLGKIEI